jgi:signal peptidase II
MYAVAIIAGDQWTKIFFSQGLEYKQHPVEIFPFFNIVIVFNRGISFGMFAGAATWMPLALTVMAAAIVTVLFVWMLRATEKTVILALGVIIGGAAGNIIDRLHYGFVIDFLDFHLGRYHWPAFNIADTAVFIGVVILCLMSIVTPGKDH